MPWFIRIPLCIALVWWGCSLLGLHYGYLSLKELGGISLIALGAALPSPRQLKAYKAKP